MKPLASPVDYLSRDTIRRALGQPLLPKIRAWTKLQGITPQGDLTPKRHRYVFEYGLRKYTIWPLIATGYIVQVAPGEFYDTPWVSRRGGEYKELRDVPSAYTSLDEAVTAANTHAWLRGVLT